MKNRRTPEPGSGTRSTCVHAAGIAYTVWVSVSGCRRLEYSHNRLQQLVPTNVVVGFIAVSFQ